MLVVSRNPPPFLTFLFYRIPPIDNMDLDAMLAQEIEDLNRDTEEDRRVKEAVILDKRDPNKLGHDDSDDSLSDEEDLEISDPELFRTTERNRQIVLEEDTQKKAPAPIDRPAELVFSDPPITITEPDRIVVMFYYGLCKDRPVTKSRKYMMTCDFGDESMYAMSWAMGTMLRDGDEVHVVTVFNLEDPVDELEDDEKYSLWREVCRYIHRLLVSHSLYLTNLLKNASSIASPKR